ncbi:MAG: c-type cytochrome domain-containing protein [Verrucomicrobiales bacterium]
MIPDRLTAFALITLFFASSALLQSNVAAEDGRKLDFKTDKAYEHVIVPILASRCIGCHGADKAKGKFRLHMPEEITKSKTIVPDKEGVIPMVMRINLPDDDEDVMPPEDKERLSAGQKKLIGWWIGEGASFDKKISELKVPDDVNAILAALVYSAAKPVIKKAFTLPEPAGAADAAAVAAIKKSGVLIMQLAQDTKYLSANAINVVKSFNDAQVKLLTPVKGHLTWLDVSRSGITDAAAGDLGQLGMLTKLHLENTAVTDKTLQQLGKLTKLEYLNLYATKVSDAGLEHLKNLKNLKKLYVWQTGVTEDGAKKLKESIPGLDVNLGWKEPEAKPAEPKK